MSFWIEEEEEDYGDRSPVKTQESEVHCLSCGGTDFYVDQATGNSVCNMCFTQSQSMSQSQEIDYDEVMALAAKRKGGGLIRHQKGGKKRRFKGAEKSPLEPLDSRVKIPDLDVCLKAMQKVMRICTARLSKLLNHSKEERRIERETVKKLWMNYLNSWAVGAEFYGHLHPDIRFSLRDHFLPDSKRVMKNILKHLSYRVGQEIRQEEEKREEATADDSNKKPKQEDRDPIFEMFSDDDDETNPPAPTNFQINSNIPMQPGTQRIVKPRNTYDVIMNMLQDRRKTGYEFDRKDVALSIVPSMKFIASLLWVTVARTGVTPAQITNWIADDEIPLLNAFRLFDDEEKQVLKPMNKFFSLCHPPPPGAIETGGSMLAIACGLKKEYLFDKKKAGTRFGERRSRFLWLTPSSIPVVTERFVRELGLGSKVFDFSLGLMGLKESTLEHGIPKPLPFAVAERVSRETQILAVIMCAAQLDGEWRKLPMFHPSTEKNIVPRCTKMPRSVMDAYSLTEKGFQAYKEFAKNVILKGDGHPVCEIVERAPKFGTKPFVKSHDMSIEIQHNVAIEKLPIDGLDDPGKDHLRSLVLDCIRVGGARIKGAANPIIVLDLQQDLLLEALAVKGSVASNDLFETLQDVLGLGRYIKKQRTKPKQACMEADEEDSDAYLGGSTENPDTIFI